METIELPAPVGFVLGGGGSLAAGQVGMLRALAGRGIRPDLVVGTSIGSVNGHCWPWTPTTLRHGWRWPGG